MGKVGNHNFKEGETNPYYPKNKYSVRVGKKKENKMVKLSNKEKINLIKDNLFMRADKLAKKAGFSNISSLYEFCSANKVNLSPNKHILNYIKKNISTTSISFMKKITGYTKQDLYKIMADNNISIERFRPVKNINTKVTKSNKKKYSKNDSDDAETSKKEIVYEKISHEHLNGILMNHDNIAQSFIRDLSALSVGEALCIKKENWTLRISPHFYFKKILSNSPMKAKVKELNEDYYVIRLK